MTSLHKDSTKPAEIIHPTNLHPEEAKQGHSINALSALVDYSAVEHDVSQHLHAPLHDAETDHHHHSVVGKTPGSNLVLKKLVPGIEKLAVEHHVGNYVVVRGETKPFFESMPLYTRIGMHLLFYTGEQVKLLNNKKVEDLLKDESIKQGKIYDSPNSIKSIPSFVKTYSIQLDELEQPDITKYKSFNDFFSRRLRPNARPIQNEEDTLGICSAADCRLTVYDSVDQAKEFWIKGKNFNIPNLLNIAPGSSPDSDNRLSDFRDASLAIFRLAPADYHRFHSPIDCVIGPHEDVHGELYTVNPEAVNEPGFDVYTANSRSILYMRHVQTGLPVAFVAIGALLVGSINWTGGKEKGETVKRGDELGYFAYGGSTIVALFPKAVIRFDRDLVVNSEKPIETLVKVGYSIGKTPTV